MRYNTHQAIAYLKAEIDAEQAEQNRRLDDLVFAGYGGILLTTPTPRSNIGAAFETLLADTPMLSSPRDVVQDVGNNGLQFTATGIWRLNVSFGIEHNESNQGRTFNVRMYNVADDAVLASAIIGVGRNTAATSWASSLLVEIPVSGLNDLIQIQIGDASSTFSSVIENSFAYSVNRVNEAGSL